MPDGPLLFCDEEELVQLYSWLDDIPGLSRERRNITRDFADGVMAAEVIVPADFQGAVVAGLTKRMGVVQASSTSDDGGSVTISVDVPLANMFGYSTELRSATQGKGEFTMAYKDHLPVPSDVQETLVKEHAQRQQEEQKAA